MQSTAKSKHWKTITYQLGTVIADMNFDAMGLFVYGAARYGGDLVDVTDWMFDDLGVARALPADDDATRGLYRAFLAKYQGNDALRENYERYIEVLKNRHPKS